MKSWPESWTAKSAALSGVLALLLATGGCAKIAAWWNEDESAEGKAPEVLFNELDSDLKRYEEGGWFLEFRLKNTLEDIRKGLSDLRLNHPFSRYAAEAELREADLLFYEDRFEEALAAYHGFAKGHPSHRKVSFALYRGAICYEKQAPRTTTATAFAWIFGDEIAHDRDLSYTLSAYDSAQEIAQNYPHSPEASGAREMAERLAVTLAAHEVYVGVYYHRFEKYESAAARFATARARYPETPLYGEAGCRMGLSLEGLGKSDQARIAFEGILNLPPERFPKEPDLGLFERAWAYFRDPELLQYRTGEEFWKAMARRRLKDMGGPGSPSAPEAPQAETGVAPQPSP